MSSWSHRVFLGLSIAASACGNAVGDPITNGPDGGGAGASTNAEVRPLLDGGTQDSGESLPNEAGTGPARLFVAHAGGVAVWNDGRSLTADVAPDVMLTGHGLGAGATSLTVRQKQLVVASKDPTAALSAYENADKLGSGAAPRARLPRSSFTSGAQSLGTLLTDANDNLWGKLGDPLGDAVVLFKNASSLSASSVAQATFTHPWGQLAGVSVDPVGDRLFATQVSGAGTLVWNGAATAFGSKTHDFVLSPFGGWALAIDGNRLYGGGGNPAGISIWNGVSGLSSPTAAPIDLKTSIGAQAFVSAVTIRNDTLFVAIEGYGIYVYANASKLAADVAPSLTITHSSLDGIAVASRLVMTNDNWLYVLVSDGVTIFRDVTTTPTFVARLKSSLVSPTDVAVLE